MSLKFILVAAVSALTACGANAQEFQPAQTTPLPGVNGRIDHMTADVPGHRLFVCALGNNTVEVIDFKDGKRIKTIGGLDSPQGVAFDANTGHLLIANDGGGVCRLYDGTRYAEIRSLDYKDDTDNARFDSASKRFYVGYGSRALGIIDAAEGKKLGDVQLSGHP